jgi:hypothetical protein
VVETSAEILRIRLQHPARLAASDDLDEGRQIMVGASFGLPSNKQDRCQLARLLCRQTAAPKWTAHLMNCAMRQSKKSVQEV